jgi:hypothetical protein
MGFNSAFKGLRSRRTALDLQCQLRRRRSGGGEKRMMIKKKKKKKKKKTANFAWDTMLP